MHALHAVLYEQEQESVWRAYTANTLWAIAKGLIRDYPVGAYTELMRRSAQPADGRSGNEILADVKEMFKKRIRQRGKVM